MPTTEKKREGYVVIKKHIRPMPQCDLWVMGNDGDLYPINEC